MIKEKRPDCNILGIEPARFDDLHVPTINAFFEKRLFSSQYDVIIMQHVLEHIKYPRTFIKEIHELLTSDGIFYLEVPSTENFLNNQLDDFVLEHTSYFTKTSLLKLLSDFELKDDSIDYFMRTVWSKRNGYHHPIVKAQTYDLQHGLENLKHNKQQMLDRIIHESNNNKKIVFYGNGYYYLLLMKELKNRVDLSRCYYCDDYFKDEKEPVFNLPRITSLDENCVVVICSNNLSTQKHIAQSITSIPGMVVICPWNSIIEQ